MPRPQNLVRYEGKNSEIPSLPDINPPYALIAVFDIKMIHVSALRQIFHPYGRAGRVGSHHMISLLFSQIIIQLIYSLLECLQFQIFLLPRKLGTKTTFVETQPKTGFIFDQHINDKNAKTKRNDWLSMLKMVLWSQEELCSCLSTRDALSFEPLKELNKFSDIMDVISVKVLHIIFTKKLTHYL